MKNNPSAFSETSLGAGLVLSVSDTILQTKVRVDEHRMARSQFGIGTGNGHVEFYTYSPNAKAAADVLDSTSSGHRVVIGIVDGSAAFDKPVGGDSHGWGIEPDGYVWHNGAIVARFTSWTLNDYIGVTLDHVRQQVTFAKNGTVIGSISLPSESAGAPAYYYAATVSGNPGDLAVWANAGQTPQRYPASGVEGWTHLATGLDPLYLATEPYICASADEMPNQKFEGDIDRASNPLSISRGVKFWPWGSSAPSQLQRGGQVQINILDPHGDYDELMALDIRDQLVSISTVYQGDAFSTAAPVLEAIIDHCEQPTDQTKTLVCNDRLVLLQSQLVRPMFAPNADPAVAGKPWPVSIGICRTYVPPFYDTANLTMAAGDEPIAAVGKWRHGGREWAYTIDYNVAADGRSFTAVTTPTAKITAETTTFGGTFVSTDTDILGGDGVFGSATAQANGQPVNWTGKGGYFADDPQSTVWQLNGSAPNKYIHQPQSADTVYRLKHNTVTLAPGESCAYEIVVKNAPYYGPGVSSHGEPITIPPAELCFGGIDDSGSFHFYLWKRFSIPSPQNYSGPTKPSVTYRGTFTNTDRVTRPLIFGLICNNMVQGTGGITSKCDIESIRVVMLPDLLQNITLDGPGLDATLQDLLIKHGPLTDDGYDSTGAVAIDDDTGYKYGIHISENDTAQVGDVARLVLDSATADYYVNRSGKVAVVRLSAPEDATSTAGSLVANDFQGYLTPYEDNAENLRTRLSGCKNYDPYSESDFANVSLDDVPQIVRKQLQQQFQWTVTANAVLAQKYQYAQNAEPLPSQLDREADGQAEISRVCALYASPRNFYVGTVFAKEGRTFELGDVWQVTYPLPSLENGQQLLLVGISEQPSEGLLTLTFWGL